MPKPFFPDPVFAWLFCAALVGLAAVAAYTDTRRAIVPNRLTVTLLAIGVVLNAVRSAWLASRGSNLWLLDTGSAALGVADGLLFALAGFALAFGLMFLFWVFGLCGGGDVKLLAAVGAWTGWLYFVYVWIVSIPLLIVWMVFRVLGGGLSAGNVRGRIKGVQAHSNTAARGSGKAPGKLRITYSVPIAVATALVLLVLFRAELQLTAPPPTPNPPPAGAARVAPELPH